MLKHSPIVLGHSRDAARVRCDDLAVVPYLAVPGYVAWLADSTAQEASKLWDKIEIDDEEEVESAVSGDRRERAQRRVGQSERNAARKLKRERAEELEQAGKILADYQGDDIQPAAVSSWALDRHAFIAGASGSGKTRLAIHLLKEQMRAGCSVLALDPKPESVRDLLSAAIAAGVPPEDIVVLTPGDSNAPVPGWNPFLVDGESPEQSAASVKEFLQGLTSTWGVLMDEVLRNALLICAYHRLSLYECVALITNDPYRRALLSEPPPNASSAYSQAVDFFQQDFDSWGSSQRDTSVRSVKTRVNDLLGKPFLAALLCARRNTLNLADLWQKRRVVIVNLDKRSLSEDGMRIVGGLLAHQTYRTALGMQGRGKVPVVLALDEMGAQERFLGEELAELISFSRSLGLRLMVTSQNLSRISPTLLESLLGNAKLLAFFQMSEKDAKAVAGTFAAGSREVIARPVLTVRLACSEGRREHKYRLCDKDGGALTAWGWAAKMPDKGQFMSYNVGPPPIKPAELIPPKISGAAWENARAVIRFEKSLNEVIAWIEDLAALAKSGKISPEELAKAPKRTITFERKVTHDGHRIFWYEARQYDFRRQERSFLQSLLGKPAQDIYSEYGHSTHKMTVKVEYRLWTQVEQGIAYINQTSNDNALHQDYLERLNAYNKRKQEADVAAERAYKAACDVAERENRSKKERHLSQEKAAMANCYSTFPQLADVVALLRHTYKDNGYFVPLVGGQGRVELATFLQAFALAHESEEARGGWSLTGNVLCVTLPIPTISVSPAQDRTSRAYWEHTLQTLKGRQAALRTQAGPDAPVSVAVMETTPVPDALAENAPSFVHYRKMAQDSGGQPAREVADALEWRRGNVAALAGLRQQASLPLPDRAIVRPAENTYDDSI